MILYDIVMRVLDRQPGPVRSGVVLHGVVLFSVAVALVVAGVGCGPEVPTGSQSPGASTAAAVAGRTQTSTVSATPSPVASPQPSATVPVETPTTRPDSAMPSATPTSVTPSLLIGMRADPRAVAANGVVTYVIAIMNDMLGGADPGASVMVTSHLPAHTTYLSGTASSGATYDTAGRIVWAGVVTRGLSVAISFQVRVNQDSPAGRQLENVTQLTDALGHTATAQASVSVITALPNPTPAPPIAVHPPGARTNVKDVDLVIDAVLANDVEARRKLIAYTITPCTTALGMGGPPKCGPGEANGTRVEVFPFLGEEGEHLRRPAIDIILEFTVEGLYAVYRVPDSAFRAEYWPAGTYALVFVTKGLRRQATLFVDDGKIVRIELSRQERWPGKDTQGIEWLLSPVKISTGTL